MRYFQLIIVAAVVATPIAIGPTSVASAEEPATSQRKERQICRRQGETGTRLKAPRVCMTQSEWDRIQEDARNDMSASNGRPHYVSYGVNGRTNGNCPPGSASC